MWLRLLTIWVMPMYDETLFHVIYRKRLLSDTYCHHSVRTDSRMARLGVSWMIKLCVDIVLHRYYRHQRYVYVLCISLCSGGVNQSL